MFAAMKETAYATNPTFQARPRRAWAVPDGAATPPERSPILQKCQVARVRVMLRQRCGQSRAHPLLILPTRHDVVLEQTDRCGASADEMPRVALCQPHAIRALAPGRVLHKDRR